MKMMNLPIKEVNDWIERNQLNEKKMVQIVMINDDKGYIYSEVYAKNEDVIKYELHIKNGRVDHETIWWSESDEEGGWFEMEQISKEEAFEKRGLKEVWHGIWVKPEMVI